MQRKKQLESNPTWKSHLQDGVSARYSSLYEQKGHAIEYIYRDDIPISSIEKVGEADFFSATKSDEENEKKVHDLLYTIFRNRNERKALMHFKH